MWPFSKQHSSTKFTRPDVPLCDLHNHILFNLDDGAVDINDSILMLEGMKSLGYKSIAVTPHHNHNYFDTPTAKQLSQCIDALQPTLDRLEITAKPGGEIMLRDDYIQLFAEHDFPGTGSTFLVEFPHNTPFMSALFEKFIFEMSVNKKTVIAAHPERMPNFQKDPKILERFKDLGVLLQIDIMSITGCYGDEAENSAWNLIESETADIVSSDIHKPKQLHTLEKALNTLAMYSEQQFIRLASINTQHIFNNDIHLIK